MGFDVSTIMSSTYPSFIFGGRNSALIVQVQTAGKLLFLQSYPLILKALPYMNFYKLIPYTNSILFCFIFSACVIEKTKTGIAIYKKKNEKSTPEGFSIMKNGRFKLKNKFRLSDSTLLDRKSVV